MIDLKLFFAMIRKPLFGGAIEDPRTAPGITEVIEYWFKVHADRPIQQLAYILATAHYETGGRHYPVREGSRRGVGTEAQAVAVVTSLFKAGRIKVNYALPDPVTGKRYYGRGRVQLTWKYNYARWAAKLNQPLVTDPDLVLTQPGIDVTILVEGMIGGDYRPPHSLATYITPTRCDYVNARNIVNGGLDHATEIAGYAARFESALRKAAGAATDAHPPSGGVVVPPRPQTPASGLPTGAGKGVIAAILAALLAALGFWVFHG